MAEALDYGMTRIEKLITHRIGNKLRDERIQLSDVLTNISPGSESYLLRYFLSLFKPVDVHTFTHPIQIEDNDVYKIVASLFADQAQFIDASKNFAKLLYEVTEHPKIKAGNLNVVYFNDILIDDELVDGIGLFKSEKDVPFIQMIEEEDNYAIHHEYGYDIKGVDKGCLILNLLPEEGYRVLIMDKYNKTLDTHYWVNDYLKLTPIADEYNNTKEILRTTKDFVVNQLDEEVDKTERIDILNRTMDYFKENESYSKESFEEHVLQSPTLIASYHEYNDRTGQEVQHADFEISKKAVKQQTRNYKSVLKLDKNFHVYIHGGKDLIERGVESDGRKFYKIYYDKEQ